MRILVLAMVACLLCASETNACSADLDKDGTVGLSDFLLFVEQFGQTCPHTTPDTLSALSIEAGYGRIALPGTQVQLNATLTDGAGASVAWRASARDSGDDQFCKRASDEQLAFPSMSVGQRHCCLKCVPRWHRGNKHRIRFGLRCTCLNRIPLT